MTAPLLANKPEDRAPDVIGVIVGDQRAHHLGALGLRDIEDPAHVPCRVDDDALVIHEQPITVASTGSAGAVRVQTWSVMIVTVPDLGPARQLWRTITLDMVEVDGVWLLDGWESEIGPTPAPPAEGLVDAADSVAEVLTWRRVDGGEG